MDLTAFVASAATVASGGVLQTTTERATEIGAGLLGLAVLAGTLAALLALGYRWLTRERVPGALTLLVGLSGVALYLNTTTALGRAISGDMVAAELEVALFNIAAFLVGGVGAALGGRAGDRFATDVLVEGGASDVDAEVSRLVQTVGRVITVTVPEEIGDVVGYDPVPAATTETLAGKTFVFPRNLTVAELRERLVSRLKTDYGVGTVDIELADDGSVEYLALGSRAAGIGPTLPPATNAVAIRADPAFSASAGDLVQVWETDPMRRVLTAELRGAADDVVTVAIDAADTPKLDPRQQYRLVTLPVEDRPEREFASLLRAAEETFSTVTVAAGSPLEGLPVGALALTVVAVQPDDERAPPAVLPDDDRTFSPGDTVFAIARPEALRRLEAATEPVEHATRRPAEGQAPPPDDAVDAVDEAAADDDGGLAGQSDAGTFDDPRSGFESGEADWDEGAEQPDSDSGGDPAAVAADDAPPADGFEPAEADNEFESLDEGDDELPDTEGDEDGDDEDASKEDGSDDGDDDGGGSKSFAQLKEEFESGEADWEDDVSDSPGGDMRLDE